MEYYQKVVLNPGRKKASLWDSGEYPMTMSEWKRFFRQKNLEVRKVVPLREG